MGWNMAEKRGDREERFVGGWIERCGIFLLSKKNIWLSLFCEDRKETDLALILLDFGMLRG